MVQIQTKVESPKSPQGVEECLIGDDPDPPPPPIPASKKEKNQYLVNFICIVLGLGLLMCIMYAYVYGKYLVLRPRCPGGIVVNDPYIPHHPDDRSLEEYSRWIKHWGDESDCGVACLSWRANIRMREDQLPVSVPESLPEPPVVRDSMQCSAIPPSLRFDCLPGGEVDQTSCESRGCCWQPVHEAPQREKPFPSPRLHRPTHGTPLESLPLNVPYCFYPKDYEGYNFINFTKESYGFSGYLERQTASGYPRDIPILRMDVFYETETRIRIKIRDPSSTRWESPLPAVRNDEGASTSKPLYSFYVQQDDAAFAVVRTATSMPLFDTRNAAPLVYSDQFLQLSTKLPSEYIYGLGEHLEGLLLDTFWKRRVLWNLDQIPEPGKNTYGSHPFYLAMEPDGSAHGVFLLNSNALDVVLQPTPALTFRAIGGILDLYVFLGPTPNEVISQYTEVIGRPFLPPYWSLGYHQCRFGYKSLNKTREVWKRTRDAGIPFDVQWNDIDYMEENKDFTYDMIHYRELPDFVQDLHEVGMHYVPIIDPGISAAEPLHTYPPWDEGISLRIFVLNASSMPFIGKVWNPIATTWPDFTHPLATYYWGRQLLRYHSWVEIDGAWIDMNEPSNFWSGSYQGCSDNNLNHPPFLPNVHGDLLYYHTICMSARQYFGHHYNIHNLYGMTEAISTNRALQIVRGKRPFIISRSTFAGQGQYSGHWTGDVWSDWFNLWQSVSGILNFNMFGMPMVGADICGFHGNTTVDLCMRWMQLGAFYPFSRNHNSDDTYDQDPVAMGEEVVVASRKALLMRYYLLPYLYSLFFKAHVTGEPVARPLFFEFPKDPRTYAIDTQFMWGSGLMIAPVLKENVTEVEAYIPEGRWYDGYSGTLVEGSGSYETLAAPKDVIPLLMRGGSIIPSQIPGNTTTESRKNNMGISVAPDNSGRASGEWFWDDGDSLDTAKSKEYTHVQFFAKPGVISVNVTTLGCEDPVFLGYFYLFGLEKNASAVYVDGSEVPYDYDEDNKVLSAHGFKRSLLSNFSIVLK